MKKIVGILVLVFVAYYLLFLRVGAVSLGPGVYAPDPPVQTKIESPESFSYKKYTVTPLAKFRLKAKVLSRKNYFWDQDLVPVDLALGWGRMSDEEVLSSIKITQSFRWYRWRVDKWPIPRREIETHSANMHLVPADEEVKSEIMRVRKGDIISLKGYLISTEDKKGRVWKSSLTRKDTGNNSCELIWVKEFEIVDDF